MIEKARAQGPKTELKHHIGHLMLVAKEDIPRFKELSRSGPRFKPVTLKFRLSDEEIANFAIQRPRFPGVDFRPRLVRHYPQGLAVAHAVGYVGALSTDDLQRLDEAAYAGTSFLTTDKLDEGFAYGSEQVTLTADATTPGGLGTFGWDDEGVAGDEAAVIRHQEGHGAGEPK